MKGENGLRSAAGLCLGYVVRTLGRSSPSEKLRMKARCPTLRTPRREGRPRLCYFGCAVVRRYGLIVLKPGNFLAASSLETAAVMITSSPGFQFAGVATECLAVSCSESMMRRISWKLRPVVMG